MSFSIGISIVWCRRFHLSSSLKSQLHILTLFSQLVWQALILLLQLLYTLVLQEIEQLSEKMQENVSVKRNLPIQMYRLCFLTMVLCPCLNHSKQASHNFFSSWVINSSTSLTNIPAGTNTHPLHSRSFTTFWTSTTRRLCTNTKCQFCPLLIKEDTTCTTTGHKYSYKHISCKS